MQISGGDATPIELETRRDPTELTACVGKASLHDTIVGAAHSYMVKSVDMVTCRVAPGHLADKAPDVEDQTQGAGKAAFSACN